MDAFVNLNQKYLIHFYTFVGNTWHTLLTITGSSKIVFPNSWLQVTRSDVTKQRLVLIIEFLRQ